MLRNRTLLERAVDALKRHGCHAVPVPTTGPGTAGPLARLAVEGGADLVLVAGGDGTVNEALEGMAGSRVPLGVLPAGTANVFAMETGLGRHMDRVAERLPECLPRRIALGRLVCDAGSVTRHFLLMAGVGLDAHIVYHVNPGLKAKSGKLAYWAAGFGVMGRALAEFDVEVEGRRHRSSFALVSRVRNYGGDFEIARETTLFDDRFEVVMFEGRQPRRYLKYVLGMVTGKVSGLKGVSICRAARVRIAAPEDRRVYVQIDGESAGHLPATMEIVPDALTVLLPREYGTA